MASESEHSGAYYAAGEDTAVRRTSIDDLPDEMLINFFSHFSFSELVDAVRKVCRRWRKLSRDSKLWAYKEYHVGVSRHCNSKNCKSGRTEWEAIRIFRRARNARKVHIWHTVDHRVIYVLCDKCRRLTDLCLHTAQKLSYSTVKNLVEQCSRIQTLMASAGLLKTKRFSVVVSHLQRLCLLRLQERDVLNTHVVHPFVLRSLGDGCPRLVEIDFGRMSVNMDDLKYFLNAKKKTLKSLRIKWTMDGMRCLLSLLPGYADSLECLELYEYDIVRDLAREAFTTVGSLRNLQELCVSVPDRVPPGTVALPFTNGGLPELKVLGLPHGCGMEDNTVIAISCGCPSLRQFSITYARKLSPAAFSETDRLEHLEMCLLSLLPGYADSLKCLELYEYDIVRDLAREAFTTVGSLRNLQELCVSVPDRVPPGTVALPFTNGGLPELKMLGLPHGYGVEDNTVITISCGCPSLQQLSITYARKLSPAAFSEIDRLEHLEILDVTGCSKLSRALLPRLVGLPPLHTFRVGDMYFGTTYFGTTVFTVLHPGVSSILKLSGLRCLTFDCSNVTGVPFDKFPENLVSLRELSVQGCRVDPRARDRLTQQMPSLVIRGTMDAELQHFKFEAPKDNIVNADKCSESDEDSNSDCSIRGNDSERGREQCICMYKSDVELSVLIT